MTDKDREAFERKVFEYCRKYDLIFGPRIAVGLSGGPDSVCLLKLLDKFNKSGLTEAKITAVHVNHNLRPGECDEDEAFVRDLCARLDIDLFVKSVDVGKTAFDLGVSVEEAGRIVRYEYLREVAASEGTEGYVIATAHHKGDLSETMLMNLFRGTGLDGLCALQPKQGDLVRPLLCVTKEEITDYLDSAGSRYVTDKTNFEDIGTRNVWRNKIIPYIGEYTSRDPEDALVASHELLSQDRDFMESAADEAYGEFVEEIGTYKALDCGLRALHDAVASRVVRRLWKETFGSLTDFEAVNLRIARDLIRKDDLEGFTTVDMPFGRIMWRSEDLAGFSEPGAIDDVAMALAARSGYITSPEEVEIELCDGVKENIPGTNLTIECSIVEKIDKLSYNICSWICPLDMAPVKGSRIVLKNGVQGMKFTKAGSAGGKILKDIFAANKVPRPARSHVLAAAAEDTALWVPGAGHAAGFTDLKSYEKFLGENCEGRYLEVKIYSEE